MKNLTLVSLLVLTMSVFSQTNNETERINKYLNSTVKNSNKLLIASNSQQVLEADIIESSLTFSEGNDGGHSIIQKLYFLKLGKKLIPFNDQNEMFVSKEFYTKHKIKKGLS